MANITGPFRGSGVATTASSQQVAFRLVTPERNPVNLATIAAEGKRWQATAERFRQLMGTGAFDANVARRAQFAEEVLAVVGSNLAIGACCSLLAQATDGRILGLATYGLLGGGEAALNLQAVDPEHLPGSPGNAQLRGLGTALVAGVSREVLRAGVHTLYLHPLDDKAAEFWTRRGFVPCGRGGLMCIRGRDGITRLLGDCHLIPECSTDGQECLLCGTAKLTAGVRLPALRGTA